MIDNIINESEERAARISKLLQLITLHQNSVIEHIKNGSPPLIIEQYEELLKERVEELQEIMQETGLKLKLKSIHKKAA